jgi:hypothetical protein
VTALRPLSVLLASGIAAGAAFGVIHFDGDAGRPGHYLAAIDGAGATDATDDVQDLNTPYDGLFHFLRVHYQSGGRGGFGGFGRRRGGGGEMWAHDYPRADFNFLAILQETTFARTTRRSSSVASLNDPNLFRFPVAYIVEVGSWSPSDEDVAALGQYLLKGGFLIVDDTRDERGYEFDSFKENMKRALPDLSFLPLSQDHEIFDTFFRIDPVKVIPPYGRLPVEYWAIFEDNDPSKRLMVLLNLNNDIAEYWEYSDMGYNPIDLTNEAYKLGVNYVIYGLTH